MICTPCVRGLHEECTNWQDDCCCGRQVEEPTLAPEPRPVGRPRKDDNDVTISAGRKRAAADYQVNRVAACEWSGKANCGGGKVPIQGCVGNSQVHRHHGPIKDTTHNERENIHLICATCHNTWHAKNNPIYDEQEYAALPHNPRQMTMAEVIFRAKELLG